MGPGGTTSISQASSQKTFSYAFPWHGESPDLPLTVAGQRQAQHRTATDIELQPSSSSAVIDRREVRSFPAVFCPTPDLPSNDETSGLDFGSTFVFNDGDDRNSCWIPSENALAQLAEGTSQFVNREQVMSHPRSPVKVCKIYMQDSLSRTEL